MELYHQALEKFIAPFKLDANVAGIILSGSFIHDRPDKNSDLDIFIIEKENTHRERGNTWIDGFEIEYFINPAKQIRQYFQEEDGISPHTAHMFTNCKVLYQNGDLLTELQEEAQNYMEKQRPVLSDTQLELLKYGLDDCWKDLEDMHEKGDDFAFMLLLNKFVRLCIEAFGKIKQFYPDKYKRIQTQLQEKDPEFAELLKTVLLAKNSKPQLETARRLKNKIDNLTGGGRTEEWFLKSECTV